jgi:hypothetical protein
VWHESEAFYGFVSRLINIPYIGIKLFNLYDKLQTIKEFYPRRDMSAPSMQVKQIYYLINKNWGKHFIDYLNTEKYSAYYHFFCGGFYGRRA